MILVLGEALIDLIGHEGSDQFYKPVVGGANANVAMALAKADVPHRFLARISGDSFGHKIRTHLESYNVDLSLSVAAEEQTTLAIATIDTAGVASYAFYINGTADWAWEPKELPTIEAVTQLGAKAVQFGCLTAAIEPGSKVLADWLAQLSNSGQITLSHDLNIRPSLGFDRTVELQRVLALNSKSHIIKASDADIEWLFDLAAGADLTEIAETWTRGDKVLILTKGGEGVVVYRGDQVIEVPAQKIRLVDTVGAGDTFMANFLAKLSDLDALGIEPADKLNALTPNELRSAIEYATAAAAIVCARVGCQPPTRAEVEAQLQA
jgi:fructokinase